MGFLLVEGEQNYATGRTIGAEQTLLKLIVLKI
jgi:hypothetical protein